MHVYTGVIMDNKRKIVRIGNSLMIAIPSQLAEHDNIKEGDYMEFEHLGIGEFRLKKAEK